MRIPLFICISIVAVYSANPAQAKTYQELEDRARASNEMVKGKSFGDGLGFIESMLNVIKRNAGYVFDSRILGIKKSKLETGKATYFFKKPQKVRLEVHSHGMNNGAVVVKQSDGVIRASGGGALKFVKMTLEPDSRMLQLPNGYNVISSDLATLIAGLKRRAANGASVSVSTEAVSERGQALKIIEVQGREENKDHKLERIFVDTKTKVPVRWEVYRNGDLVSITEFDNFKPRPDLSEDLFQL
ncbi:MAG: DUF1571 domain-containing protein [Cyanobacteria bacterium HKST-UBA02]|nr:DUF1571 domain-containing protein [Cyanobacteria bacterium HKST-UBA02]